MKKELEKLWLELEPKNNITENLDNYTKWMQKKIASILWKWEIWKEVIEYLSKLDDESLFIFFSEIIWKKIQWIDLKNNISRQYITKYCKPKEEDVNKKILIEYIISKNINEGMQLVELSPLTPVWLNVFLSDMSQKRTVSTINWYDVISDWASWLALLGAKKRKKLFGWTRETINKKVSLWSNNVLVRTQTMFFDWKICSPFLRVFQNWIFWREGSNITFSIEAMKEILELYLKTLYDLNEIWAIKINELDIYLSDMRIAKKVFQSHIKTDDFNKELKKFRHMQLDYPLNNNWEQIWLFNFLNLNINPYVSSLWEIAEDFINLYWLYDNIKDLWKIYDNLIYLEKKFEKLWIKFKFNLERTIWIWQYNSFTFNWISKNKYWNNLDFMNWWYCPEWAVKLTTQNREKSFFSTLSTDFLANYF